MPDNNFRAAMYGRDDEDDGEQPVAGDFLNDRETRPTLPKQDVEVAVGRQTVTIVVDGKPVLVPTMAYVQSVEKKNEEQARAIRRLEAQIKQLRAAVNTHTNEFNDVYKELDRKINLRDM